MAAGGPTHQGYDLESLRVETSSVHPATDIPRVVAAETMGGLRSAGQKLQPLPRPRAPSRSTCPRALSSLMEPFDRGSFAPWLGALRMAMHKHRQRRATKPRRKRTRPSVGQIGFSGALRRLPDATASRFTPRLPEKPICRHQMIPFGRIVLLDRHEDDVVDHGVV